MCILVINGPNINMLGIREPEIYGEKNYSDLCSFIQSQAEKNNVKIEIFQSNHEGAIVDKIQEAYGRFDAIIINPAAYTHTSIAIPDAIKAVNIPACEVHLSDINSREDYRKNSFVSDVAEKTFSGFGFEGYKMAIEYFCSK